MSIYQPKGSQTWTMDFHFQGQRIRESCGTRSKTLAERIERKRRRDLEAGAAGIGKQQAPRLLSVAAGEWLENKKLGWSSKMYGIATNSLRHLLPVLGKRLLLDLEARDILNYQKARLAEGASNRTCNIEVGCLRQIMRDAGAWARIQSKVKMLRERDDVGRALTAEEESILLYECGRSRSRSLLAFVTLALCTGARYGTIRRLQWDNIDFVNRCLKFGRDKTAAGTNRTVPLNRRAVETLQLWAQQFPNRLAEHYVFCAEKVGAAGDDFERKVYDTDPTSPIGSIKEAWEAAKRRTQRHCPNCEAGTLQDGEQGYTCDTCRFETVQLPSGLVGLRFHDLRHSAVSRMIAARVPLPIIAKIVGWSAGTMAKMAARYGHFGIEELRSAMDATISRTGETDGGTRDFHHSRTPKSATSALTD